MDLLTWFWPKVSDRKNAQFAITEAFFAAAVVAALTAIFTAVEALKDTAEGLGPEGFVSAIVFAGVGFGIYRRSRIAAVSGSGVVSGRTCLRMGQGWPQFWGNSLARHAGIVEWCPRHVCLPQIASEAGRVAVAGAKFWGAGAKPCRGREDCREGRRWKNRRRLASRQANDVGRSDGEGVAAGAGGRRGGG